MLRLRLHHAEQDANYVLDAGGEVAVEFRPPDRKVWLKFALKVAVVALVLWGVRRTLLEAVAGIRQQDWQLQPAWLIASGVLYLAALLPSGLFWRRLMLALGAAPTVAQTLRSYYIGHLGKYVPGKAMVIVIRAGLLRGQQVDPLLAAVTIFYETLTSMAVGAFVAAAIVGLWYRENWQLVLLALAMMIAAGLPTAPPLFRWLAKHLGVGKRSPQLIDRLAAMPMRIVASGWVTIAMGWLLMGLSLWAARQSIGVGSSGLAAELPRYTASVALATVAGFVSFIPGGFGVREAVLMESLTLGQASDAESTALVSAVLLRLVWLLSELAISGILYAWGWLAGRKVGQ
jgi:uncharacterized membrane protein YbhN (UPF0104 family)